MVLFSIAFIQSSHTHTMNAHAHALTSFKALLNDSIISLSSNIRLVRSLVTFIFLCACESWPFTAELKKKKEYKPWKWGATSSYYASHIKTMPLLSTRGKPCRDPTGNGTTQRTPDQRKEMQAAVVWSVYRSSGLVRTISQGTLKGERRQGRRRKKWEENIKEWTGLEFAKSLRAVENRKNGGNRLWNHLCAPTTLAVKG